MLAAYSSDDAHQIRSLKRVFRVKFGISTCWTDAYDGPWYALHELGLPYHVNLFTENRPNPWSGHLSFAVLYGLRGEVAGGGVFISQGQVVTNLHANILRNSVLI